MSNDDIKQKVRECVQRMPQRSKVRKISLFGSHLHDTSQEKSDVDLLIEFDEAVGYFDLVSMQDSLSESIGKPVDLVTLKALSKYFRAEVLAEAKTMYEK